MLLFFSGTITSAIVLMRLRYPLAPSPRCLVQDVDVSRIIQVDVQWLLCSAAKVTKFVTGLEGCAHDLQLQLVKVRRSPFMRSATWGRKAA